VLNPSRKFNFG